MNGGGSYSERVQEALALGAKKLREAAAEIIRLNTEVERLCADFAAQQSLLEERTRRMEQAEGEVERLESQAQHYFEIAKQQREDARAELARLRNELNDLQSGILSPCSSCAKRAADAETEVERLRALSMRLALALKDARELDYPWTASGRAGKVWDEDAEPLIAAAQPEEKP